MQGGHPTGKNGKSGKKTGILNHREKSGKKREFRPYTGKILVINIICQTASLHLFQSCYSWRIFCVSRGFCGFLWLCRILWKAFHRK